MFSMCFPVFYKKMPYRKHFFTRHWLWNSWIVGLQALVIAFPVTVPFIRWNVYFLPAPWNTPSALARHPSNTVWWLAHTSPYQLLPLLWLSLGGTFISYPRFRNNPWALTLVSDEKQQWHVVTYILTESSNVEII